MREIEVEAGAEVTITRHGKPVARLVAPVAFDREAARQVRGSPQTYRRDLQRRRAAATEPAAIDAESHDHVWTAAIGLAERHRLCVYDAVYLEIAQRRRLPLATSDDALRAAARDGAVDLLGH